MTLRAYLKWQAYWEEEPWGPWRDNLHAGIIAREVRRRYLRKGATSKIDDFMVISPERRREKAVGGLFNALKSMAKIVKRGDKKR